MKNVLLIFLLLLAMPTLSMGTTGHTIEIEFSFTPSYDSQNPLLGYRLYKESEPVCDTSVPDSNVISCDITSEDGTFDFTLTALYSDNTESPSSPPFPFTLSSASTTDPLVPLTAVITPTPVSGEIPLTVSFDGINSTGNISAYSWDFGDGQTSTDPVTSHTYTSPGTYTAVLQVMDQAGTSQQTSTTIVAQQSSTPSSTEPPTAVLTSSTAAGNAPLQVTFETTGSSAASGAIMNYLWTFGDGSEATGATVSHTFTEAGTYYTRLTIEDSQGLTDTVSTPVIVIGEAPANEKPVAVVTASIPAEASPLTFFFDGSQSHDDDGSISTYSWRFGDGTTGTGRTVLHSYEKAAVYTATLQVTDDRGDIATTSIEVVAESPQPNDIPIELGEVTVDHNWITVNFENRFNQPVIIAGPPTTNDADPVLVRLRNVNETSFQVRLQEWDYQEGEHAAEKFSYIVIEEGLYTLDNGVKIEAGSFTGSSLFETVSLKHIYDYTPVIMTQILTENEADAATGRHQNINQYSFEYKLQEMELTAKEHDTETIGYIAWEPGEGEIANGIIFEAGMTTQSYTHDWSHLTFANEFPNQPFLLAEMQTCASSSTATVRRQGLTQTGSLIKIEEEQSKDSEVKHNQDEIIGYFSLSAATPLAQYP